MRSAYAVATCRSAFFPPGLHPVLNRGQRDEHPVIPPKMPGSRALRQAILHDPSQRPGNHPARVVSLRQRRVVPVGREVNVAASAVVLGTSYPPIQGAVDLQVARIVQDTRDHPITIGRSPAGRTRSAFVVAGLLDDLGPGQIFDPRDAFAHVGQILAGTFPGDSPARTSRSHRIRRHFTSLIHTKTRL